MRRQSCKQRGRHTATFPAAPPPRQSAQRPRWAKSDTNPTRFIRRHVLLCLPSVLSSITRYRRCRTRRSCGTADCSRSVPSVGARIELCTAAAPARSTAGPRPRKGLEPCVARGVHCVGESLYHLLKVDVGEKQSRPCNSAAHDKPSRRGGRPEPSTALGAMLQAALPLDRRAPIMLSDFAIRHENHAGDKNDTETYTAGSYVRVLLRIFLHDISIRVLRDHPC